MIKGTHNSCTAHPLLGWQKFFSPFINLVSKCQNLTVYQQYELGVRLFDFQVAPEKDFNGQITWRLSHGIAKYDVSIHSLLTWLEASAKDDGTKVYIIIEFDHRIGSRSDLKYVSRFNHFVAVLQEWYPSIEFIRSRIEVTNEVTALSKFNEYGFYWTSYWSRHYAKWKFWTLLPLPKLWHKIYFTQKDFLKEECIFEPFDGITLDFVEDYNFNELKGNE